MKFIADRMLGKLATWLRLMGYDTLYRNTVTDPALLALLESASDRILLSRHADLVKRLEPHRYLFVAPDDPESQLRYVIQHLGLTPNPDAFFTRCSLCNGLLESVNRQTLTGKVPEYVWETHEFFSRCKNCGKVYWPGSHVSRFHDQVKALLENTPP